MLNDFNKFTSKALPLYKCTGEQVHASAHLDVTVLQQVIAHTGVPIDMAMVYSAMQAIQRTAAFHTQVRWGRVSSWEELRPVFILRDSFCLQHRPLSAPCRGGVAAFYGGLIRDLRTGGCRVDERTIWDGGHIFFNCTDKDTLPLSHGSWDDETLTKFRWGRPLWEDGTLYLQVSLSLANPELTEQDAQHFFYQWQRDLWRADSVIASSL